VHRDWVAAFAAMTAFGCFAPSRNSTAERHPGRRAGTQSSCGGSYAAHESQYLKVQRDWVAAFAAMTAFGCFAPSRNSTAERHPGLGPGPSQVAVARMLRMKVST